MIKEGKFGVQEAVCIVTTATVNRIFFTAPTVVGIAVGTAGWYMALISDAVAILAFTFIYLLLKRFPNKNILEIFDITFGRFIGFLLSFIFAASFIAASGILLREFVEILKIFSFPNTPQSILTASIICVVVVASYLGLETIARVAKLAAYTSLLGYLSIIIMAIKDFKFSNLFPILGYGVDKTIIEGVSRSSAFSEVIILTIFVSSLQGIKYIKKAGYISLIISGVLISSAILCISLVIPYYSYQELTAPLFVMVRLLKFGSFFQRLEPLYLFMWIISLIIACSIVFYSAVSSYCKAFRLQDTKPVIIPLAVLLFSVATFPKDFASVVGTYIEALRVYPIFLFYVLPLITLIVAAIRKKKGDKRNV